MVLHYILTALFVLVCFVLLLVVLLQQGRGGDIASAFGGSGSQAAFGVRSGATLLTRVTTVAAVLFMLGALVLAVFARREPGSVVGTTPAPPAQSQPAQQPPPPPLPTQAPEQKAPEQNAPQGQEQKPPAEAPAAPKK